MKTNWLSTLLDSKFFGSCIHHSELHRNEENVFCIDCSLGCCRHCREAHRSHQQLQICKYVYNDVVRLQEIQKHLDCSNIQTYKINGKQVVHLNSRPPSKDTKPSAKYKSGCACEGCGRFLQDLPSYFCSVACKVSAVSVKRKDQSQDLISTPIPEIGMSSKENSHQETNTIEMESSISVADSSEEIKAGVSSALKPRTRRHKRKEIFGVFCFHVNMADKVGRQKPKAVSEYDLTQQTAEFMVRLHMDDQIFHVHACNVQHNHLKDNSSRFTKFRLSLFGC